MEQKVIKEIIQIKAKNLCEATVILQTMYKILIKDDGSKPIRRTIHITDGDETLAKLVLDATNSTVALEAMEYLAKDLHHYVGGPISKIVRGRVRG